MRARPSLTPLLILLVSACGGETVAGGSSTSTGNAIGAAGGIVTSSDGEVTLTVPKGALNASVNITILPVRSPGGAPVGQVYDIEPTGTMFASPVTLTFAMHGLNLGSADTGDLQIATYAGSGWQAVSSTVSASAVTAQISHFSPWGVVVGSTTTTTDDAGDDAGYGECVQGAACATGNPGVSSGCGMAPTDGGAGYSCMCVSGTYECTAGG